MATITRIQPQIQGSILHGVHGHFAGGLEQPEFVEAAGATFDVGDFIYLTGGKLALCPDNGGATFQMTSAIAGIAKSKATGVTDTRVHFEVIRPDTMVSINVYHGTPASAALARAQLGTVYALRKVSGVWTCDLEGAAETAALALGKFKVISFMDKIGDIYGRVLGLIVPMTLELDSNTWVRNLQLA